MPYSIIFAPENDNPFRVTLNLVLENQGNLFLFFNSVTHWNNEEIH